MKRKLCRYCGMSFRAKKKGVQACSSACRSASVKSLSCARRTRKGSPGDGVSRPVDIDFYRKIMSADFQ
jgi:hypothetical protein